MIIDKIIKMPSIPFFEPEEPELLDESAWGKAKRLRFGNLRIMKDRIVVNNGIVDSILIDANGLHGYDNSGTELIRVNYQGLIGYDTAGNIMTLTNSTGFHAYTVGGVELVRVDSLGFHGYDASGAELSRVDNSGSHYYDGTGIELIRVDSNGFHAYTSSGVELVRVDSLGFHGYNASGVELSRVDNSGSHYYNTSGVELIRVDSTGFHAYNGAGNEIVRVTQTGVHIYNTSLQELVRLDAQGLHMYRAATGAEVARSDDDGFILRNTRAVFFEETTAGQYGDISVNSANQMVISLPTTNQFFIKNYAGTENLFTVSTTQTYSKHFHTTDEFFELKDGISEPATEAGYARIYVDSADGDLKVKFGDGTVQTIVTD